MAPKMTTIQVRVDEKLKNEANKVLAQLHINMSQAIKMFLSQVVHRDGIPISMRIPNAETLKAIEEAEQGIGLHEASSVDELFKELDR
jgi:DNA-damage-inducible protein J